MGSFFSRLRTQSLKRRIEELRHQSASLAGEFETAPTETEKTRIARRYDEALKQTHAMQLLLELIERKEREATADPSPPISDM